MSRIFVGVGCKGRLARKVQEALKASGYHNSTVDGHYGNGTAKCTKEFQFDNDLAETGSVDAETWLKLMGTDKPSIEERCLQATASIEGHGFTKAHGNWDGAWLTWGIIGFTLKYGMVDKIILNVYEKNPDLVTQAFGDKTSELISVMKADSSSKTSWANSISEGSKKYNLIEPWTSAFKTFGLMEDVQQEQIKLAVKNYFNPAKKTFERFNLKSELGMGLCFDIHVQNGSVKSSARQEVEQVLSGIANPTEQDVRQAIANAVANKSNPRFSEDVRARKMAFATGSGISHGYKYVMENWGLTEEAAF